MRYKFSVQEYLEFTITPTLTNQSNVVQIFSAQEKSNKIDKMV